MEFDVNTIITGVGPKNTTEKLWKVTASGGYTANRILTLESSKRYIFYTWIKKEGLLTSGSATFSFGVQGNFRIMSNGTASASPWFINSASFNSNEDLKKNINNWLLAVGVIFPYGTENAPSKFSGIYDSAGKKIFTGADYRWANTPASSLGEKVSCSSSANEVTYIARPSIYEYDPIKGPFIERIIGL